MIRRHADGFIKSITDQISSAIGSERDDRKASCLKINATVEAIRRAFHAHSELSDVTIIGALYDIEAGVVTFHEATE